MKDDWGTPCVGPPGGDPGIGPFGVDAWDDARFSAFGLGDVRGLGDPRRFVDASHDGLASTGGCGGENCVGTGCGCEDDAPGTGCGASESRDAGGGSEPDPAAGSCGVPPGWGSSSRSAAGVEGDNDDLEQFPCESRFCGPEDQRPVDPPGQPALPPCRGVCVCDGQACLDTSGATETTSFGGGVSPGGVPQQHGTFGWVLDLFGFQPTGGGSSSGSGQGGGTQGTGGTSPGQTDEDAESDDPEFGVSLDGLAGIATWHSWFFQDPFEPWLPEPVEDPTPSVSSELGCADQGRMDQVANCEPPGDPYCENGACYQDSLCEVLIWDDLPQGGCGYISAGDPVQVPTLVGCAGLPCF